MDIRTILLLISKCVLCHRMVELMTMLKIYLARITQTNSFSLIWLYENIHRKMFTLKSSPNEIPNIICFISQPSETLLVKDVRPLSPYMLLRKTGWS